GGRRDRRVAVVLEPLLDLLLGRAVGRERHEEMAAQGTRKRRRAVVRSDGQQRSLIQRRRFHAALFARWKRRQPVSVREVASARGRRSFSRKSAYTSLAPAAMLPQSDSSARNCRSETSLATTSPT